MLFFQLTGEILSDFKTRTLLTMNFQFPNLNRRRFILTIGLAGAAGFSSTLAGLAAGFLRETGFFSAIGPPYLAAEAALSSAVWPV